MADLMRRIWVLSIVRSAPVLVALAATGCGHDNAAEAIAAVHDGSAAAAIQRHFDATPECAPVLDFWTKGGLLETYDDNPAAATLVAAGLLEFVPGDPRPHERTYRPAPAAHRWFRNVNPAEKTRPYLCFARRVIREVSLVPDGDMPTLRYTFTLEDPPRWMARADMIATFPGVALAYGDNIFASDESVRFENGRVIFDPTYMNWDNSPFYSFSINFIGTTPADHVDVRKITLLAK